MGYTRDELLKAMEMIVDTCEAAGNNCKGCPFQKDRETNPFHDYKECIFNGESPLDWMDINALKYVPEKKYVPFDLSNEDDQMALIGKALRLKPEYMEQEEAFPCLVIVTSIEREDYPEVDDPELKHWFGAVIGGSSFNGARELTGLDLLKYFTFADTGKPVGREVKDERNQVQGMAECMRLER